VGGLESSEAVADAKAAAAGLPAMDSISQWDYWRGATNVPPRTEVAIGGEVGNENGGKSGVRFTGPTSSNAGVEALVASVAPTDEEVATMAAPARTLYKLMVGPSLLFCFLQTNRCLRVASAFSYVLHSPSLVVSAYSYSHSSLYRWAPSISVRPEE
jgi:hypothetical protein